MRTSKILAAMQMGSRAICREIWNKPEDHAAPSHHKESHCDRSQQECALICAWIGQHAGIDESDVLRKFAREYLQNVGATVLLILDRRRGESIQENSYW